MIGSSSSSPTDSCEASIDADVKPTSGAPITILPSSSEMQKDTESPFDEAPLIGEAPGERAIAKAGHGAKISTNLSLYG